MEQSDIEFLLSQYQKTKEDISTLEKKLEKYKNAANKIMTKEGTNTINGSHLTLTRKNITRESLGKSDVPNDIWTKYSKKCTYQAYYLNVNK